jgi:general secretion pathway protein D
MRTSLARLTRPLLVATLLGLPMVASAQDPDGPEGTTPITQTGPRAQQGARYTLNGEYTVAQLIDFFASRFEQTILVDDPRTLTDTVQFIGRSTVSYGEAYQAMLAGLEVKGYSVYEVGGITHIVKNSEASQAPIRVGEGGDIPFTASYVTQIISLDSVAVADVQQVITSMASADAKVVAYAPTNTLILTDSAYNLRKIYDVLQRLDVASPSSSLKIYPIAFASASEVAQIIEQIYGTEASGSQDSATAATSRRETAAQRRRRRRREREAESTAATTASGVTAGKASAFISKVIADERTNSLIVLANESGHEKIVELIADIDVDVDLTSRSQIHVVYLEHAKADEIATVLSNLSGTGNDANQGAGSRATRQSAAQRRADAEAEAGDDEDGGSGGVLAAFDSGMRITSDENTNSLVIIASNDDFRIVESVISSLDVRRKQVYVDCVILEIASDDSSELGIGYHAPGFDPDGSGGGFGLGSAQLGASSLGLSQDLLTGLALGVFGESIEVPISTGAGTTTNLSIPSFGIVLSALKTNSLVNIVSSPSLLTLDNQEAEITVGRRVPFPTQTTLSQVGGAFQSFQREDVATTLQVTPRINSSDEVTLELTVEVSDIEEDDAGLNAAGGGPVTSKREVTTTALVSNNSTMVLGGLVGSTESEVETKVPILGDLPLIGNLFRGSRKTARRTNLLIFLTPHIIDSQDDIQEVMRIKMAQRAEFERRFYGKSQAEQEEALQDLLSYSMNFPDRESEYIDQDYVPTTPTLPRELTDEEVERYLIPGTPRTGQVVPGDTLEDEVRIAVEEALAVGVEPIVEPADDETEGE